MNNSSKYDWIVGICYSDEDGVKLYRFYGTIGEMKETLLSMIQRDREQNENEWNYGCETVEDIRVEDGGLGYELYGYGSYENYHADYTAKEFAHLEHLCY